MNEEEAQFITHSPLTQVSRLGQPRIKLPFTELMLQNDVIETKKKKKMQRKPCIFSMFTVLCLATLIAILGCMQPMDPKLDVPEKGPEHGPL